MKRKPLLSQPMPRRGILALVALAAGGCLAGARAASPLRAASAPTPREPQALRAPVPGATKGPGGKGWRLQCSPEAAEAFHARAAPLPACRIR